jgi:acetylornithine deacetylase/succinyl-diaminopimelate desuccinylase-like protein
MSSRYQGNDLPSPSDLLEKLIAIPSINPGHKRDLASPYGEAAMVAFLRDFLKPWADRIVIQEVLPGRPNFIAYFEGATSSRCFAFEAHTDTVEVSGMTIDPFRAKMSDGKVFGRGACDNKGPMVAMLLAIIRCLKEHGELPCDWLFIATCDEELGGKGAAHLISSGFKCDGIIVAEPTQNQPLIAHKGASRWNLKVCGKSAHSAYPENGANAIHAAAEWISLLEKNVYEDSNNAKDWDSKLTFSTGVITGGAQVNLIPNEVEIQTDWRIPPVFNERLIYDKLSVSARLVEKGRPNIRCEFSQCQNYPAFTFAPTGKFSKTLSPLFDPSAKPVTARYATNAGFFSSAGIPALVFGPGSIAQAHTADEWISLDEIKSAILKLRAVIENS